MARVVKMDRAPGEFRCRKCQATWSSFMANNNLCTDAYDRDGLHDFDFKNPVG